MSWKSSAPSEEIKAKTLAGVVDMARSGAHLFGVADDHQFRPGRPRRPGIPHLAGLKQAWTWAVLLAILNYIPYLGPLIAGVFPFIDALLSTAHPRHVHHHGHLYDHHHS